MDRLLGFGEASPLDLSCPAPSRPKPYSRSVTTGPSTVSDLLDRLKTALADRYAIERELGAGGMAAVQLLESVRVRGHMFWSHLRVPEYDPLRDNPRFQALLAKYEN